MNFYQPDFLCHYKPLVLISGLANEESSLPDNPLERVLEQFIVDYPLINNSAGKDLANRFQSKCLPLKEWESSIANKRGGTSNEYLLNVRLIGRTIRMPPLKSKGEDSRYPNRDKYSILSPLNPRSPLYPNGLMNENWVQKYLYFLPHTVVSTHWLEDIKSDDDFCSEIRELKGFLAQYGTKLIVIVLSDISNNDIISDRIHSLRRNTGLAARVGFFFLPKSLEVEKETLVESVCKLAYTNALEALGALSRQIKRKIGKGHHQLSQSNDSDVIPLPSIGWEIRCNFKLAALAEFRQDIEAALSIYESAYDATLELFEVLTSTSGLDDSQKELWLQSRCVLDVIAYKIVKMCLYMWLSNVAYRKFNIHITSVSKIINQKGFSSDAYSFVNWLSMQYRLLAKLVEMAGSAIFPKSKSVISGHQDNDPPGLLLPRSGFLYLSSIDYVEKLSSDMNKRDDPYFSELYDFDAAIIEGLQSALEDFSNNEDQKQNRTIEYVMYRMANLYCSHSDFSSALPLLKKVATGFRKDKWNLLLLPLIKKIVVASAKANKVEDYLFAKLEYLTLGGNEDLLDGKEPTEISSSTSVVPVDISSFGEIELFNCEFGFESSDMFIGMNSRSQLKLILLSATPKVPITLNYIRVEFSSGIDSFIIEHDKEYSDEFNGFWPLFSEKMPWKANLEFNNSTPRIFEFNYIPHQLGEVALKRVEAELILQNFKYRFIVPINTPSLGSTISWLTKDGHQKHIRRSEPLKTKVSPRPSRLLINNDAPSTVIAGEIVTINFTVVNEETEPIILELSGRVNQDGTESTSVEWTSNQKQRHEVEQQQVYTAKFHISLSGTTNMSFDLQTLYRLTSDEQITVKDSLNLSIPVSKPFRVNFDVQPRIHYDEWSSIFIPQASNIYCPLIYRRWYLCATLLFLGQMDQKVEILGQSLEIIGAEGVCSDVVELNPEIVYPAQLKHNEGLKINCLFDVKIENSKEQRNVNAEGYLKIKWKRVQNNALENVFSVAPVKLVLPLYMPRVVVDLINSESSLNRKRQFEVMYFLENATSHTLSYEITMGSSSGFAFQGPKLLHLRLLPFTRKPLYYNLVALSNGNLKLPSLRVYDPNYKRTLVIISANKWIKSIKGELYIDVE